MRVLYGIIVFFALFLLACSDAEREEKRLEGNLLMKGDSGVCYDGIGLTESYLVLLARGCDTIIQVFDKDDLSHLHAFALKGYGATYFSNPEFMKSNTKEPAGKDEFYDLRIDPGETVIRCRCWRILCVLIGNIY